MQFADPTRGRSQPRVRACKARAKPELQGPHFPVGARKCLQGGKAVSQTQSTTCPHSLRDLDTLSTLTSLRPPTFNQAGGCVLHGV